MNETAEDQLFTITSNGRLLCPSPLAAPGAPGVPGVAARAVPEDDGGEAAGPVPLGRLQRGGGPQGAEVAVREPQGPGREGKTFAAGRVET